MGLGLSLQAWTPGHSQGAKGLAAHPLLCAQALMVITAHTPPGSSRMSNGLDPVAETAIRQLTDLTNKPAKKTPTKRSTLIISGVSKVSTRGPGWQTFLRERSPGVPALWLLTLPPPASTGPTCPG